jgi:hypothetical protein
MSITSSDTTWLQMTTKGHKALFKGTLNENGDECLKQKDILF